MNEPTDKVLIEPEAPPIFGTWRRWYAVVLIELVVIGLAAYALTEAYR